MVKDNKKALMKRLKIIEGQVRGLHDMIEKGTYCIDVITQTSAVKSALSSMENTLLEDHLKTCVMHQVHSGKEATAVKEILKVYSLKRK